jgi:hypothetical protein
LVFYAFFDNATVCALAICDGDWLDHTIGVLFPITTYMIIDRKKRHMPNKKDISPE